MATLRPFRAVRPIPESVEDVAAPPYDVVSTEEAREQAQGKPRSFLHVVRPEIDLSPDTDPYDESVYEQGAANLRTFVAAEYTVQEAEPSLYVYRLTMGDRTQTGIFGCVSVAEYDDGTIVKHEETRPAKEEDRTRHILAQEAHAEPVMLTFRDVEAVQASVEQAQRQEPLYDFEAADGVRHTIWKVQAPDELAEAFQGREHLYIADGHHRSKAASRAAAALRSGASDPQAGFESFPAVLFPMSEMHIMAYNRVVFDLPESPADFLDRLDRRFALERDVSETTPARKGEVCLYLDGAWHRLTLPPSRGVRVVDQLDVARLGEYVLEPHLSIRDPRRDPKIDFVGGIRGTEALEARVDRGEAELAFSMYPTSVEELVAVADEGSLMPPKSTWFEPKLRSGLLVHDFADDIPADGPAASGE
ncbi:MAG: DUF1015 domain-containing protein [Salinivenus sp.]